MFMIDLVPKFIIALLFKFMINIHCTFNLKLTYYCVPTSNRNIFLSPLSLRLYQEELARRFGADKQGQQGQLTGSGGQDSLAAALQEGLSLSDKIRDIPPEITKLPTQQIIRQIRKWAEEVEGIIALVTASSDKLLGREVKFDIQLPGYS